MVYIVIRPKNGVPYVSNFCEDYMEARRIAARAVRKDTDVDLFQGIPYKEGTTKEEIAEKLEKDSQPILHLWQNLDEAVWLGCPSIIESTNETHKEWLWRINGEMRHFEAVYRVRISSAYNVMQRSMLERQYLSEKHRKLASLAR